MENSFPSYELSNMSCAVYIATINVPFVKENCALACCTEANLSWKCMEDVLATCACMNCMYMGQLVFEIHTSMYLLWKEERNRLFRRFIYTYIYMFDIFYIFQNLRYQWNNYLRHYNSLTYIKQWIYKAIMLPYLIDQSIAAF